MQLLVTGAANGIGASLTELAMKKGHRVIATDADIKALNQRWEHQPSVRCEPLDVRDEAQWKRLISKLEDEEQTIEMLANVAGVLRSGRTGNLNSADIRLMLDVNVLGAILGTNALAAHMISRCSTDWKLTLRLLLPALRGAWLNGPVRRALVAGVSQSPWLRRYPAPEWP